MKPGMTVLLKASSSLTDRLAKGVAFESTVMPRSSHHELVVSQLTSSKDVSTEARGTTVDGSPYLPVPGEDIEALMVGLMIFGVCRYVKPLQLPVVTNYTCPLNPITSPNPMSSY
jgi:hypothetical protein